ncbi:MAG: hypothetical protein ETSY2_33915 [Candidatus Entotheonella gemina]|uniref:Uncharacterized protein n=2 Tax=Candidatus Entotheonella TaxID=93171 RepID=W4LZC5_9BACT|nr:MAG: hypothetical protein ETSY2_33915 [Candidatus Entotheonella gemina]
MNVIKIGNVYKATRITGPQHHFLGLVLSETAVPPVMIEPLSIDERETKGESVDEQPLIDAVQRGVTAANEVFGTQFHIERRQYVTTDTPDPTVYETLAKQIVERASMDVHPKAHVKPSS